MSDTPDRALRTEDGVAQLRPFSSLVDIQERHDELLERHDLLSSDDSPTEEFWHEIAAFVRRTQVSGVLLEVNRERRVAQSLLDYWANALFRASYAVPDARLAEFDPTLAPELPDEPSPYRGLAAFDESDAPFFFGREVLVNKLLARLANGERLLAVVGASGSGKSSIVVAGLLPRLKAGALPNSELWRYLRLFPGSDPLDNLARALAFDKSITTKLDFSNQAKLLFAAEGFRRDEHYLSELLADTSEHALVLVIDQFEELFTLCTDERARQAFVAQLITLAQAPEAEHRVLLTMRTDFVDNIAKLPALLPLFRAGRIDVEALDINELRAAIEQPATKVGLKFEEGIVDDLISTILGERAGLPLLQFTLLKLWEARERNRITRATYAKVGNPRQALERSAEAFYNSLIYEEQLTAKRILLQLVRPGAGREVTSNRIRRAEVFRDGEARDRVERVLERLIHEARLVKLSAGESVEDAQIEVAHEALVRNWPRLVEWLDEERVVLRGRQRLTEAAQHWERLQRDPGALLSSTLLLEARRVVEQSGIALNEVETEFLAQSQQRIDDEAQREIARQVQLAQAQAKAKLEALQSQQKTRIIRGLTLLLGLLLFVVAIWGARELQRYFSPWQPVFAFPSDPVMTFAIAPATSNPQAAIYCAGTKNIGVGCSLNGLTWNIYQQGLSTGSPVEGGTGGNGLYSGHVKAVTKLAIDPANPKHVFAIISNRYVFKSVNGGIEWQQTIIGPEIWTTC
jgi:hypothetical protein